jgi:hypothetical protein
MTGVSRGPKQALQRTPPEGRAFNFRVPSGGSLNLDHWRQKL